MSYGSAPQESKPQPPEQRESCLRYKVTRRLNAYPAQEGSTADAVIVDEGVIVWADPDFWNDKPWKGELVVRFLSNETWFYADRETFVASTRRA
jgi:hypothetical protein